jgi:hypothetical protein
MLPHIVGICKHINILKSSMCWDIMPYRPPLIFSEPHGVISPDLKNLPNYRCENVKSCIDQILILYQVNYLALYNVGKEPGQQLV